MHSRLPNFIRLRSLCCLFLALLLSSPTLAQSYRKGQFIEPAYEGWWENEDGTFSFVFGYHNENWEEELDVPIGDNNYFEPGAADRGQPTHFLPRRNRFTFEVVVPADWGDKELAWTVTSNGVTRIAYATLARDYVIDNVVIASETGSLGAGTSSPESRANIAPTLTVMGDRTGGEVIRRVRVGEPLRIETKVEDDGLPKPRAASRSVEGLNAHERMMTPPRRTTVGKTNGLFLSWNVYRGAGEVHFDPPQVKPWEDTRASANSPWGALWTPPPIPEDGMYNTEVVFSEPGTYVLWGRADDGGLYHDGYITVIVTE
ncbi:MAG: hypothetical protein H7A05_02885 [Pseudomonadales bacterium]|nr:hypothetical protein [Pseudomonadales bacterium]MCP5331080.1 hypothetical protein [Pseudomonadales bacterium]MCP5343543.1 hypothetical protein [Pseudomonadales bacterium]